MADARGAEDMTEADLEALGVHRIPVPIPFPQAGGPVNAYLLEEEDGGFVLYDAGLGTPEAVAALEAGFARAGRRFEDVRRILVSHGHIDHYGAAQHVVERAGHPVAVHVHPADLAKVAASGPRWRDLMPVYGAYLLRLGVPAEGLAAIAREVGDGYTLARRVEEVRPLAPGEVVRTRHLALEVVHMPGHTPGLCCLWDPRRRIFLAADHLLQRVSPNPIIELGPGGEEGHFRPLLAYLESVARLRALDVALVLPGHGPAFGGHREVIDGLLGFYERRQLKVRELLARGPLTAYEVTRGLFPAARPGELFLVVSEAIANLEVLEDRGEVRRELDADGRYRFALAA